MAESLSSEIFSGIARILLSLWWIWGTFLAGYLFAALWMAWRQFLFKEAIVWSLLEVKVPREVKKGPKAMEQIMANIWSLKNTAGNIREWWWDGEVTLWFSFEIVSLGGDIRFYIRTPSRYVNIIRANLYGHYPECEVEEVDDYIDKLPATVPELYEAGYEIFGLEMKFGKTDAYPVRTYLQFESDEEAKDIDPIAGLLEVLSKIDREEIVVMQILARPVFSHLTLGKLADQEVTKLKTDIVKKAPKKGAALDLESAIITARTPGETELFKLIEAKASKQAFECMIRYVYLAPQSIFSVILPYRGLRAAFQQFAIPNLNFFDVNYRTWTRAWMWDPPYIFPKRIKAGHRERLWQSYRKRLLPAETTMGRLAQFHIWSSTFTQKSFYLNTEELATLWHLPTAVVLTQPILKRIEARKLGPPAGLPIFREGEEGLPGIMG